MDENSTPRPAAVDRSNRLPVSPANKPPRPSDRNHSPVANETREAGA